MRIAKVIAVMFFSPAMSVLAGFAVGVLAMPTQTPDIGRAPGDGFLIMSCAVFGLLVSILLSAVLAGVVWSRSSTRQKSN